MKLLNWFVDLDFFPAHDYIHSGRCVRQNRHIVALNDFNDRTGSFDGFSVFRIKDISKYRFWTTKEIRKIKKSDGKTSTGQLHLEEMNTIYSCLKWLGTDILAAVYIESMTTNFWVAKIVKLSRTSVTLKPVDSTGKWLRAKTVELHEINSISFMTAYAKKLERKISASR